MKKFLVVFTVLMFMFVSCGGDDGDIGNTGDTGDTADDTGDDTGNTGDDIGDTGTETDLDEADDTDIGNTGDTGDDGDTGNTGDTGETCQTEGETRIGETVCGSTNHGKLYQECVSGVWTDTEKCTCDPGEYPEVCGTYAQKMWFTAASKVATINMAEAWTRTYFVLDQEQEQDKVHIKAKICNIKIDNTVSYLLQMMMPQSFADALPILPKESTLVNNGDGTYGFTQDVFWELRSVDPNCYGDNPGGYTLPQNSSDPCAQDWDNDGVPGLYVKASGTMGGDIHIVEKSSSKFVDSWFAADGQTAGGVVEWTDEQVVLQASSSTLKMGADNQMKETSDKFEGIANFFEQFKVPDGSDCTYVVTNAATIFNADPINIDE